LGGERAVGLPWHGSADRARIGLVLTRCCCSRAPRSSASLAILRSRPCSTSAIAAGDLDNRCKAVLDYLERVTVIADDRLCDRLIASWGKAEHGCCARVWPVAEQIAVEFTPEEAAMCDRVIARWAEQLGISEHELEDRLG
jgi:hypothetical protein